MAMSTKKKGATQGRDPKSREAGGREAGGGTKKTARPVGAKKSAAGLAVRPPSQRQLRVAEEIRHVLAGVFGRGEIHDPDLAGERITVAEVRLSPDLKHATAFVSRLGRTDIEAKLPALRRAATFLRGQVAHALRLRYAPNLHFQADTSVDYAMFVDGLLRQPGVARDLGKPVVDHEN